MSKGTVVPRLHKTSIVSRGADGAYYNLSIFNPKPLEWDRRTFLDGLTDRVEIFRCGGWEDGPELLPTVLDYAGHVFVNEHTAFNIRRLVDVNAPEPVF